MREAACVKRHACRVYLMSVLAAAMEDAKKRRCPGASPALARMLAQPKGHRLAAGADKDNVLLLCLACGGWGMLAYGGRRDALSEMLPLRPASLPSSERDVVFLVDGSGSMAGEPFERVKEALARLVVAAREGDHLQLRFFTATPEDKWIAALKTQHAFSFTGQIHQPQ